MVQYWGFSYGTVIGSTLAAMFPDRIKIMVLDGVVHGEDYMGARWSSNVYEVDRMLPLLAKYCYQGGPTNCALVDTERYPEFHQGDHGFAEEQADRSPSG